MLEMAQINDLVSKTAAAVLAPKAGVRTVMSEPTVDSGGNEALNVTIVLTRGSLPAISDDQAVDMLWGIDRALRAANEERFPILSFVTEEELEQSDSPES